MRRPAGYYNRLITIRDAIPVPDRGAIDTKTPEPLCSRVAHLKSGAGREATKKSQTHATVETVFELPYDDVAAQALPDMHVLYGERTFEILAVQDVDDAHEEIRITTVERIR